MNDLTGIVLHFFLIQLFSRHSSYICPILVGIFIMSRTQTCYRFFVLLQLFICPVSSVLVELSSHVFLKKGGDIGHTKTYP